MCFVALCLLCCAHCVVLGALFEFLSCCVLCGVRLVRACVKFVLRYWTSTKKIVEAVELMESVDFPEYVAVVELVVRKALSRADDCDCYGYCHSLLVKLVFILRLLLHLCAVAFDLSCYLLLFLWLLSFVQHPYLHRISRC